MAERTKNNPIYGYEDWSKLMREAEAMLQVAATCVYCGGAGDVWETDYTGQETLVPCPDCYGLGMKEATT